jgi:hypothetical protein
MNCRFIFANPQAGAYFSVKVKAFGGTKTANNLYGNQFMGEWNFIDIFKGVTGTPSTATYQRNNVLPPTSSPWRNGTTDYVFGMNTIMLSGSMSLASVLLYDTSSGYIDK